MFVRQEIDERARRSRGAGRGDERPSTNRDSFLAETRADDEFLPSGASSASTRRDSSPLRTSSPMRADTKQADGAYEDRLRRRFPPGLSGPPNSSSIRIDDGEVATGEKRSIEV